jgi:hypothetical protein
MGFNDKFASGDRSLFPAALVFSATMLASTRNSNRTVGIEANKSGVLADRSPSGRQRSDFMSFQTSIISFVLQPCR